MSVFIDSLMSLHHLSCCTVHTSLFDTAMPKHDMSDHIYDNTRWMKNNSRGSKYLILFLLVVVVLNLG